MDRTLSRRVVVLLAIFIASLMAVKAVYGYTAHRSDDGLIPSSLALSHNDMMSVSAGLTADIVEPRPEVQAMIDQVISATVRQINGDLSGEWPIFVAGEPYTVTTRYTGSGEPISRATRYVGQHLASLGLAVEYHQWGEPTYPNVIGELPGGSCPEEIFIIAGHLDSRATTHETSMILAPGADDNGSGSTAVLVAASILSQYEWGPTIRFALFTGEEQGLLGSRAYVQRAVSQGENIRSVINLDMIGWNAPGSAPVMELHTRSLVAGSSQLAGSFAQVIQAYGLGLTPEIIVNGSSASDHSPFWNAGYPAILAIEDTWYGATSDFNPNYHTVNDRLADLDIDYFTDFVKAAVGTMAHESACLGQVEGTVSSTGGDLPIAGAAVHFVSGDGWEIQATTDATGKYHGQLSPGIYTVTATASGYYPVTLSGEAVEAGSLTTIDISLAPWPRTYLPLVISIP